MHLILIESISALREARPDFPAPVILVPTMGALHAGHASLVSQAREEAGEDGTVVVTVFVNPTQFGPGEDLDAYPRTLEDDMDICAEAGGDVMFAPAVSEIYPADASTSVLENSLSQSLCGASRPGHFAGVGLIVMKLFNLVEPDTAVFGKKDYQQLAIIRRIVRDLDVPVEILGGETVREEDGLAMSSRNRYLTESERAQAPSIRAALLAAAKSVSPEETFQRLLAANAPDARIDYADLVHRDTLQPLRSVSPGKSLLAAAVFLGKARLIDNIEI